MNARTIAEARRLHARLDVLRGRSRDYERGFDAGYRAGLQATTKPQATEPPNSDQYDVVIPEPRP